MGPILKLVYNGMVTGFDLQAFGMWKLGAAIAIARWSQSLHYLSRGGL